MEDGDRQQLLLDARAAADRSDWSTALEGFREADACSPLSVDDLERAALAAMWLFDFDAHVDLLQRAFGVHMAGDDPQRAVPLALELSFRTRAATA